MLHSTGQGPYLSLRGTGLSIVIPILLKELFSIPLLGQGDLNCNPLVTRKVLTGGGQVTGVGLSLSCHRAPFDQDHKLQEFGETLGNPGSSAVVALFSTGCCLLTAVSGTVDGDQGEHSLFAPDGRGSRITYTFCEEKMCPWTGDLSSVFLPGESRQFSVRGSWWFLLEQELMQNYMGGYEWRGNQGTCVWELLC